MKYTQQVSIQGLAAWFLQYGWGWLRFDKRFNKTKFIKNRAQRLTLDTKYSIIAGSVGGVAEWLKATDCKSVLSEYAGSNPASSTICSGNLGC
jgi:hypothetical protein